MSTLTEKTVNAVINGESVIWGHDGDVYVDGAPLSPDASQNVMQHGVGRFTWAKPGPGTAKLAVAMLLAAGAEEEQAMALHQDYQWEVLARLSNPDGFVLLGRDIIRWLESATALQSTDPSGIIRKTRSEGSKTT